MCHRYCFPEGLCQRVWLQMRSFRWLLLQPHRCLHLLLFLRTLLSRQLRAKMRVPTSLMCLRREPKTRRPRSRQRSGTLSTRRCRYNREEWCEQRDRREIHCTSLKSMFVPRFAIVHRILSIMALLVLVLGEVGLPEVFLLRHLSAISLVGSPLWLGMGKIW
jgi:hypothetical protein